MKKLLIIITCITLLLASCEEFDNLINPPGTDSASTDNSETDTTTTPAAPAVPGDFSLDAVSSATLAPSIEVSWTDNSDNETGFTIERSTADDFSTAETLTAEADRDHYLDKTIFENTEYFYRLRADNSEGSSDWTETKSITFAYPAPAAPSDLSAERLNLSSCTVSWSDNSYCEDGFTVEYSESDTFSPSQTASAAADETTVNLTGLNSGGYYYIRARAYNDTGNSEYSVTAEINLSETPPAAPSAVSAAQYTNHACKVSWIDNSSNEEGFVIEYSTNSDFSDSSSITADADTELKVVSGLAADSTCYFRVRAAGVTVNSTAAEATPVALVSQVPNTLEVDFIDGVEHGLQKVYVIWIEADGYYKNVFIGTKLFADRYTNPDRLEGTALPYWQINKSNPAVDTVSGATITDGNFTESVSLTDLPDQFKVCFEIDHSRDGNDWFGDQPAILYEIEVDLTSDNTVFDSDFIGWTANEYTDDDPINGTNNIPGSSVIMGVLQTTTGYISYINDGDGTYTNQTPDEAPATDLVGGLTVYLTTQ